MTLPVVEEYWTGGKSAEGGGVAFFLDAEDNDDDGKVFFADEEEAFFAGDGGQEAEDEDGANDALALTVTSEGRDEDGNDTKDEVQSNSPDSPPPSSLSLFDLVSDLGGTGDASTTGLVWDFFIGRFLNGRLDVAGEVKMFPKEKTGGAASFGEDVFEDISEAVLLWREWCVYALLCTFWCLCVFLGASVCFKFVCVLTVSEDGWRRMPRFDGVGRR